MTSDQLAIVLLGAFWAGTSAVMSGIKLLNDARDRILTGKIEGEEISVEHRIRLFYGDWLPMRLALATVSLVLAFIILRLPQLANPETMRPSFPLICYAAAVVPVGGFLNFIVLAIPEYMLIRRSLPTTRERKQAE